MAEKDNSDSTPRSPAERGTTTIADSVVAKTAGIAAREVTGVHALGGTASQMKSAVRKRVGGGTDVTQGVSVEVGQSQAAIDLSMQVDYGQAIHRVAKDVRNSVVNTVERTTGLEVVEVNITVSDVYLPGEDGEESEQEGGGQQGPRRNLE